MAIRKDLTGKRFNRLTVIEYIGKTKYSESIWKCVCDCGSIKKVYYGNLIRETTRSCGCLSRELSRQRLKGKPSNTIPHHQSPNRALGTLFRSYERAASHRNIEFELNISEFEKITNKNCYYCGKIPSQDVANSPHTYKYNGIDRINNNIGYVIGNSVPCCKQCNYAKRTLDIDEFTSWISRAYHHLSSNEIINS